MLTREVHVGEHVLAGGIHHRAELGLLIAERIGYDVPLGLDAGRLVLLFGEEEGRKYVGGRAAREWPGVVANRNSCCREHADAPSLWRVRAPHHPPSIFLCFPESDNPLNGEQIPLTGSKRDVNGK